MSGSRSRRELLRKGAAAAALATGGCLWDNPQTAPGHVYAENTSPGARRLALWVATDASPTPDPAVAAVYRLPDGTALEFDGVLEPEQTYYVRAALTDASSRDVVSVTVDRCDADADEGERVVSVRTRPDGLGIIPFGCQESYTQRELDYVPADDHRVRSLDRPLTSTAQ